MNGNGYRGHNYSPSHDQDVQLGSGTYVRAPPARAMLDGYNEASGNMNGTQKTSHPPSSSFAISDPVTMHLLVETAIGDSQDFEVLSFEEIDELKKESKHLASRIDAIRRKLTLESKVRDAAQSLNRLYSRKSDGSDSSSKRHRRSFLGSKGTGGESLEKTDDELAASSRKCEDLAQELWRLEHRDTDIQRRLLQHTAGVLQMTHRANSKRSRLATRDGPARPGSPGSIYTYSRGSVQPVEEDDYDWDDRSQYRTLDEFSGVFDGRSKSRSPARPESRGIDTQVVHDTERRLQDLNSKLRNLIVQSNPDHAQTLRPLPSQSTNGLTPPSTSVLQDHLDYLESSLDTVGNEMHHSSQRAIQAQASEPVLLDLWVKMQQNEADARQRKRDLRQSAESDVSPDEDEVDEGAFSAHALSSKVQFLHRRTVALKEQKGILRRQIKQQRVINNNNDDSRKDEEMEHLKTLLRETDEEATKAREEVVVVMDRLETAQNQLRAKDDDTATSMQSRDLESRSRIDAIQKELVFANESKSKAETDTQRMKSELNKKEEEMRELEQQTAMLQTEVTIAKAELDGVHGTKAQKAAEIAAQKDAAEASGHLKDRMQLLEKELKETIAEYETMTKQSIEFEKERETLEQAADALRDKCEGLESQLSDEKLKWLGVTAPGGKDRPTESTSTMVIRNEFKKMMRDTRAEHSKALKAEIEERRKLETQLRSLRGNQTPGKSSLSQSTSAS
ncbi:MAG: hypothetical protein M1814_001468 [Vezdaea aestivalis]|nr:MAG: hypothetical protein M1814_001468 [Vezdaea aestivalis]